MNVSQSIRTGQRENVNCVPKYMNVVRTYPPKKMLDEESLEMQLIN
jgi:hypothetical protein